MSILAVDVDFFKAYNDSLGHPAGDECLKQVARALASVSRRPFDAADRTGGEEFVVALYAVAGTTALRLGEKLRVAVEALRIPHPGSPLGHVTVSVGVATIVPDSCTTPSDALHLADEALYDAKRAGRNCVMMATVPGEAEMAAYPPRRTGAVSAVGAAVTVGGTAASRNRRADQEGVPE